MSIQFKRSSSAGVIPEPTQLSQGELALNLFDRKLYTKDSTNKIINIGFSEDDANSKYLLISGGTLTGRLMVSNGTLPPNNGHDDLVSKRYVDMQYGDNDDQVRRNAELDERYVNVGGDTMTGSLLLTDPITSSSSPATAINKGYADGRYVNTNGDTMTGPLILHRDPTLLLHAATKKYVDEMIQSLHYNVDKLFPIGHTLITTNLANPSSYGYPGSWVMQESDCSIHTTTDTTKVGAIAGTNTPLVPVSSHSHTGVTSKHSHNHSRGSMNITGNTYSVGAGLVTGAFYRTSTNVGADGHGGDWNGAVAFDAARTWSGVTSSNEHDHSLTVSDTGIKNATLDVRGKTYSVYLWTRTA